MSLTKLKDTSPAFKNKKQLYHLKIQSKVYCTPYLNHPQKKKIASHETPTFLYMSLKLILIHLALYRKRNLINAFL